MESIAERLNRALDRKGAPVEIRGDRKALQQELRKRLRGSRDGTSYPAVLGYFAGNTTPSLPWINEAADLLGVRRAYLAFGSLPMTVAAGEVDAAGILKHAKFLALRTDGASNPLVENLVRRLIDAQPADAAEPTDAEVIELTKSIQLSVLHMVYALLPGHADEVYGPLILALLTTMISGVPRPNQGHPIDIVTKRLP